MGWMRPRSCGGQIALGCSTLGLLVLLSIGAAFGLNLFGRLPADLTTLTVNVGLCPALAPSTHLTPPPAPGSVYLAPLGDTSDLPIDRLRAYYQQRYQLDVIPLAPIPIDEDLIDPDRDQVSDQDLYGLLLKRYPDRLEDRMSVLIGVTTEDLYMVSRPDWGWAFGSQVAIGYGSQAETRRRVAVISTARMGATPHGLLMPAEVVETRLRKMLTRYIGELHFQLPRNDSPRSVLYRSIVGVPALDCVGEEF